MPQVPYFAQAGTDGACTGFAEVTGVSQTPALTFDVLVDGDRTTVTVRGELDIDVDWELDHALRAAVTRSVWGIELDLSGVTFCDCSGLNTLLAVRLQARRQSKTVTIRAASPAVHRVLTLTGTWPFFKAADDSDSDTSDDAGPEAAPEISADRAPPPAPLPAPAWADGADERLRTEVIQLRRAMQTRPTIDLARGILMASFGLTPEDAWSALVMTSQHTNAKVHRVAQGLVDTVSGTPLPESVQLVLSDVLTKVGTAEAQSTSR
ncbi:STAS domain-containing protein [Streptomyces sp. NPDC001984]|uniref:STAS domain-containing protein n=2 Tax=unclassified Streptomyces TaxID=2593676 RepID=UPI0036C458E2